MGIEVKCCKCGKKEIVKPSRALKYKTCSYKCMGKQKAKGLNAECSNCKKPIKIKPYKIKNQNYISCSKKCSSKLKSKLYMGRNNPNTKYFMIKDNMFKKIDSEEKAYLLGWIASDGSVSESGNITISVHNRDKKCLQILSEIVSNELKVKEIKGKEQVSLDINSKEISEDICKLLQINFGKKSYIVRFPNLESDELKWAFLRGYFDGDGSIRKITEEHHSPECNITSNSIDMINDIKNFCKIPCHISVKHSQITWNGNNCLDFLDKLYDVNSIYRLERKFELYLSICTWVPSVLFSKYYKNDFFKFSKSRKDAINPSKTHASDSGFDLTLLEKIKQIGDIELYDTGIKIKPAYGYYFDLVPRSSIIKSGYMLANSIGIIDRTYLGNIMVPLVKIDKNAPDLILPNRLVQLIPRQIIHFNFNEVENIESEESARGDGGFGSTNK